MPVCDQDPRQRLATERIDDTVHVLRRTGGRIDQRRYSTADQIGVVAGACIRTWIEARNKGDVHEVLLPERAANPNRVNYTVGP